MTSTPIASRTLLAAALLLAPSAVRAAAPPPATGEPGHDMAAKALPASPAAAQLERLKALAGTWKGAAAHGGSPAVEATVTWQVTAAGSAVVETIMPGTPHEMVTVYHLDGRDLVLTHYCSGGNQPSMRARPSKDPSVIAFDFVRGSNMKPGDAHMHSARIALAGEDKLETEWTSWKGGKAAGAVTFTLARQK